MNIVKIFNLSLLSIAALSAGELSITLGSKQLKLVANEKAGYQLKLEKWVNQMWMPHGALDGDEQNPVHYSQISPLETFGMYRGSWQAKLPGELILKDNDARAYLMARGISAPLRQRQIDDFVQGCKALGLWDRLSFVPCRSELGGLVPMGGATELGTQAWTLHGDAHLSPDGVNLTLITSSTYPNRLDAPLQRAIGADPIMVGSVAMQNEVSGVVNNISYIRGGVNRQNVAVGTYAGVTTIGGIQVGNGAYLRGLATSGVTVVVDSDRPIYNTQYRPVMMAASFTGTNEVDWVIDQSLGTKSGATNQVHFDRFSWVVPASNSGSGTISSAWLYRGRLSDAGAENMRRFWALINSTLYSDWRAGGLLYWHLAGQSNAAPNLASFLDFDHLGGSGQRCSIGTNHGHGGRPITYWVGTDPLSMERQPAYLGGFFNTEGTAIFQRSMPIVGLGKWRPLVIWMQGESDTETYALASQYKNRLKKMIEWIREDMGREDVRFVIGKIDYSEPLRNHSSWTQPSPSEGGTSRTQRVEMVRQAQQEIADEDPWIDVADSRGCSRPGDIWDGTGASPDAVHMTSQGYRDFAARIKAAIDNLP